MNVVRAIAFDMDGTLVDIDAAIKGALGAVLDEVKTVAPAAETLTVDDLNSDCDKAWATMPAQPWPMIRRAGFARTLGVLGQPEENLLDHVCDVFFAHRYPLTMPFDEVQATLDTLRARYVVGVASNGNSYPEKCGLAEKFDFQVYAHVDGVPPKPAPAFYARVAQAAGVAPEDVLFVGDSLSDDIAASQRAGMKAIWLNRSKRILPPGIKPDAVVTALDQLPSVIAALNPNPPTLASPRSVLNSASRMYSGGLGFC